MPETLDKPQLLPDLTFSRPQVYINTSHDPSLEVTDSQESWINRHKKGLTVAAFAVAGAVMAAPEAVDTLDKIKENADWAIPVFLTTELSWNIGAAMVLAAAGTKIGNPLTLRQRFQESYRKARHNATFKIGRAVNLFGEVGTYTAATAGTVAYLPPSSWPVAIGAATLVAAPGAAFQWDVYKSNRAERNQIAQNDEVL